MPEKTIKPRLQELDDKELASDDGPIFSAMAKLVEALSLGIPTSRDLELKADALRLGYELLRGTKYQEAG
jgi:hypothetical protein